MNETLAIGWVYPDAVNGLFMHSVTGYMVHDYQRGPDARLLGKGALIGHASGPRIASARNGVIQEFLDHTTAEWLLMVDSDMVFTPDAVDKLFDAADPTDCPIVGGLCFGGGRSGRMFPTLYRLHPVEGPDEDPIEVIEDYPDNALCEVNGTGAAFLLMHRGALERIGAQFASTRYPWFAEGTVAKAGISFGEDWAFCIRAQSLDIPIKVHTGAKIGHVKSQVLNEDSWLSYRERRDDIGNTGITREFRAAFETVEPEVKIPTWCVIPQRGYTHLTEDLCQQIEREKLHGGTLVIDNGTNRDELDQFTAPCTEVLEEEGGIYHLWNQGYRQAKSITRTPLFNLAVLNNDIRLGPHALKRMASALRDDPKLAVVCPNYDQRRGSGVQYVHGSYGQGGIAGWCFMVKAELFGKAEGVPFFDEEFAWWYGDDDFLARVEANGWRLGVVLGATAEHLDGGSQTERGTRDGDKELDRKRLLSKWPDSIELKGAPCPS